MKHRIERVVPRPGYRIWIRFADGLEGELDLSDLAGKGVFARWREPGFFEQVVVDPESATVAWPGGIDLAPDALYEDVAAVQAR
jgi:hypothetical protein